MKKEILNMRAIFLALTVTLGLFAQAEVSRDNLEIEMRFTGGSLLDTGEMGLAFNNLGAVPMADRHGNPNSAYYFDGVDDYMRNTGVDLTMDDFTISMWVTMDEYVPWYRFAFAMHSGLGGINYGDRCLGVYVANQHQLIGMITTTEAQLGALPQAYVDVTPFGTWHHLTLVREGAKERLYFDGMLVDLKLDPQGTFSMTNGLVEIGAPNYWNGGWSQNGRSGAKWKGGIDDVLFYSRALSDGEIQELLNEGMDDDGDGIPNDLDSCPDSDLASTVIIDGCDTGIENTLIEEGCTLSDIIHSLADSATNHGQFVSDIASLGKGLKDLGLITGKEKGKLQSCAAKADLP